MQNRSVLCLLECLTSRKQMVIHVLRPALTKQRLSLGVHTTVHKLHKTSIFISQLQNAMLHVKPNAEAEHNMS